MKMCELCGRAPSAIEHGHFAGQVGMHDYCAHCSQDLCDECFELECDESPTLKHEKEE